MLCNNVEFDDCSILSCQAFTEAGKVLSSLPATGPPGATSIGLPSYNEFPAFGRNPRERLTKANNTRMRLRPDRSN